MNKVAQVLEEILQLLALFFFFVFLFLFISIEKKKEKIHTTNRLNIQKKYIQIQL